MGKQSNCYFFVLNVEEKVEVDYRSTWSHCISCLVDFKQEFDTVDGVALLTDLPVLEISKTGKKTNDPEIE